MRMVFENIALTPFLEEMRSEIKRHLEYPDIGPRLLTPAIISDDYLDMFIGKDRNEDRNLLLIPIHNQSITHVCIGFAVLTYKCTLRAGKKSSQQAAGNETRKRVTSHFACCFDYELVLEEPQAWGNALLTLQDKHKNFLAEKMRRALISTAVSGRPSDRSKPTGHISSSAGKCRNRHN